MLSGTEDGRTVMGLAADGGPPRLRRRPQGSQPSPVEAAVGDTLAAALAVLVVAAAIGRHAVEVGVRVPRTAVHRLPAAARLPATTVRLPAAAARLLGAVADDVVPRVARAILSRLDVPGLVQEFVDLDRLAGQLDVNAVTARVDLDTLLARVDVEAIAAGLDLDALAEKLDVGRIIDRIDLDELVARVDLDRFVDRADIDRIIHRVDLDEIVARVDLDRAVNRVDVGRIIDRVDVNRVVDRADIGRIIDRVDLDRVVDRADIDRIIDRADIVGLARYVIEEIDLAALVRSSTGSVSSEMVRSVRDQGADADRAVERVVDRLLRRRGPRAVRPLSPSGPAGADERGRGDDVGR
jgi:hypothetical protein